MVQLYVRKKVEQKLRAEASTTEVKKSTTEEGAKQELLAEWEATFKKEARPERKNKTRHARMTAKKAAAKQKKTSAKGKK